VPGTGSISPVIKPSSACTRELRSAVDEAEELKTLAHIRWHQPRTVVAAGDQPFDLYPRQGHPGHAPLPACSAWALSGSRAATVGSPFPISRRGRNYCRPESEPLSQTVSDVAGLHADDVAGAVALDGHRAADGKVERARGVTALVSLNLDDWQLAPGAGIAGRPPASSAMGARTPRCRSRNNILSMWPLWSTKLPSSDKSPRLGFASEALQPRCPTPLEPHL